MALHRGEALPFHPSPYIAVLVRLGVGAAPTSKGRDDYPAERYAALDHALDKAQYYSYDGTTKSKFHPKGLPPSSALPESVSTFIDASCSTYKVPAQRSLSKVVYHDKFCRLFAECHHR